MAFFSAYYKIGIPDNFIITGQVDEKGNIKKIGGLKAKIIQTIRNSKIKNLILPQENHKKALKILDNYYKRYFISEKLKLHPVNNWEELIKFLFQWRDDDDND